MVRVDVCSVDMNGKIIHFYRVVDKRVRTAREISSDEYVAIRKILRRRGYKEYPTRILGKPSYCFTYYNVDEETTNEIMKYGKHTLKLGG